VKKLILLLMAVAVGLFGAEVEIVESDNIAVETKEITDVNSSTVGITTITNIGGLKPIIKDGGLKLESMKNTRVTTAKAEGGIYDISELSLDSSTDIVFEAQENGQTLFYVAYSKSSGGYLDSGVSGALNSFSNPVNGGYYNSVVTHSNSFGGWAYFSSANGGYNGGCQLVSRNQSPMLFLGCL